MTRRATTLWAVLAESVKFCGSGFVRVVGWECGRLRQTMSGWPSVRHTRLPHTERSLRLCNRKELYVAMDTPQGWYQDPSEPTLLRWWDGTKWTSHTAPNQQHAPQPMTQTALPYGYSQTMSHESSPSSNGFVKAGSIIQIVSSALGFMLGVIMLLLGNEAEEMFPGVGLDVAMKVLGVVTAIISVLVLVLGIMAFRGRKWAIVTSLVLYGLAFIQDAAPAVSSGNPADLIGAFPVLTVVTFVLLFVGLRKLD